jgi:hypothetical protein
LSADISFKNVGDVHVFPMCYWWIFSLFSLYRWMQM